MRTVIKYLKLPLQFDAKKMQEEVAALSANWIAHYNQKDYEGSWTALPLRSVNGATEHVLADGEITSFKDTLLLEQCPYIQSVLSSLECDKNAVRLLNLEAGAVIKEHKDTELCFESGEARIHIPVMTNDAVSFFVDGERVVMNEGECWYANFNLKHSVSNAGNTSRIHIVADCIVNEWLRDMFSNKPEIIATTEVPDKHSRAEKQAMIDTLLAMNTPTSLQLAKEIQESIDQ